MSELRKVELPVDELCLEEAARELGLQVRKNTTIRGFATRKMVGSTVVQGRYNDIGVVKENGRKRIIYDDMCQEVDAVLEKYIDKYINKRLMGRRIAKQHNERQLVYLVS
jgi:basic membrane lipoprotein Med (substrate-binding protein (PBP1-ABC) superfamily)